MDNLLRLRTLLDELEIFHTQQLRNITHTLFELEAESGDYHIRAHWIALSTHLENDLTRIRQNMRYIRIYIASQTR